MKEKILKGKSLEGIMRRYVQLVSGPAADMISKYVSSCKYR